MRAAGEATWLRGGELRVGDIIRIWHSRQCMITALRPYTGPLAYLWPNGAQLADLAPSPPSGITIVNDNFYEVWRQPVSMAEREMIAADLGEGISS